MPPLYPAVELSWPRTGDGQAVVDRLYAALDEFSPIAIEPRLEPATNTLDLNEIWRVFFRSPDQRDAAATALRDEFDRRLTRIVSMDVPDEGWARRSQENLRAVRVGRIVVSPPWDEEEAGPGSVSIVIDPSTGFGTGHHETTRLCLTILQRLDVAGRRVIDVGTGSGVLAIAAAKLGAARVIAMDNDPEALRNSRENISRNGCDAQVDVAEAELASLAIPPADIITANLTAAVLDRHASVLVRLLNPGGSLVVSGFGPSEVEALTDPLAPLTVRETLREGSWSALRLQ
jgi:ribosomal protein L11 methyltransferase